MTYGDLLRNGAEMLRKAGIDTPELDARLILEFITEYDRLFLHIHESDEASAEIEQRYMEMVVQRARRKPLQYLTGSQDFMGLTFKVSSEVLIPRADTETLVEKAIEIYDKHKSTYTNLKNENNSELVVLDGQRLNMDETESSEQQSIQASVSDPEFNNESIAFRILDMCTGSGAIAISCLHSMPDATAVAADISGEALEIAAANAADLGVSDRIKFVKGDMFGALKATKPMRSSDADSRAKADEFFCCETDAKSCESSKLESDTGLDTGIAKAAYSDLNDALYDMILSNPPYIETNVIETLQPEVRDFEPAAALDGGSDGLEFYEIIAKEAPLYMKNGAHLLLEIGYDQADAVTELLLKTKRFDEIKVIKDLAQNDRVIIAKRTRQL